MALENMVSLTTLLQTMTKMLHSVELPSYTIGIGIHIYLFSLGFPGGSDGKESTCNAGDLGLIPGLGRSPAEGIGYPLQYSWASLVAQLVKNPLANAEDLSLIPA